MPVSLHYRTFQPYLERIGVDTVDPAFYEKIRVWDSWYRADVPGFHLQYVYNGLGEGDYRRLRSLDMAKKVCENLADVLMNEKVQITIDDDTTSEFVKGVLKASNFAEKANEYQERKAATGTVAYVPCLYNIGTDADGGILSADVRINYASALNIFPTAWHNGEITEAIFAFPAKYRKAKYYLMQRHYREPLEDGYQYVITNDVIDIEGKPIPRLIWENIPAFRGLPDRLETGIDEPFFAIDKPAIVNSAAEDDSNPMGMAIFAGSINVLAKLDVEYDSYYSEFELGAKKLLVPVDTLKNANGSPVFDPRCRLYYKMPEDAIKETGEAIHEVNLTIRSEEHEMAINQDLNLLSLGVGYGTNSYRFEKGGLVTATQVISENSDQYRTIRKDEIILEKALTVMMRAVIRFGIAAGVQGLDPDTDIKIDFDDSIIEDKATERKQDREDVAMGVMGLVEYRAKWYGETEEIAAKRLPDPGGGTGVIQ